MQNRRQFVRATAGAALTSAIPVAWSSTAPLTKPARLVVGFPPGGSTDYIGRLLAEKLRGPYANTVLVDNRAGAGGRIAADHVKNADPDGSTALFTPGAVVTLYPHVYRRMTYDALTDLTPVCMVATFPVVLLVSRAVPESVTSLAQLLAWVKLNPSGGLYGTPGAGGTPHFIGAMLSKSTGVRMEHVPYKGSAPVTQDLMGGSLPMGLQAMGEAIVTIQSGKVRALATTATQRSRFMPNVPTFTELGYPDIVLRDWFGLFLPRKASPETVAHLHASTTAALSDAQVTEGLIKNGYEPGRLSVTEFAAAVREEHARWGTVVEASGFKSEED